MNAEQLKNTRAAANEAGVLISIHMSESPFEVQYSKDTFGMTSIAFFESIGFLDGPTIAAHIDSVDIGITNRWRRRGNVDFFGTGFARHLDNLL